MRLHFISSFIFSFALYANTATVVGSANIPLSGPVTKEITESAKSTAAATLRRELYIWLKENSYSELDTNNTFKNHVLTLFMQRCLSTAGEESAFKGRIWNFSYVLTDEKLAAAVQAHDSYYDSLSRSQWGKHQEALSQSSFTLALSSGVKALGCAMATLSKSGDKAQVEEIQNGVQRFFDRMHVLNSEMMIEGKPGSLPVKYPNVTILLDSMPLMGVGYTAFVQNNRRVFQSLTDDRGSFSIGKSNVPFVHNGSFLTLTPDASFYLDSPHLIRFKDMGIKMNKGQDLSFIYKVPTLTYSLIFKAFSPKGDVEVPKDFAADGHIRKYLKDSCNLQPAKAGTPSDLSVKINTEISRQTDNETGEASLLVLSRVAIQVQNESESGDLVYEKRHEVGTDIQMGPFFWEAAGRIRSTIREVLDKF